MMFEMKTRSVADRLHRMGNRMGLHHGVEPELEIGGNQLTDSEPVEVKKN